MEVKSLLTISYRLNISPSSYFIGYRGIDKNLPNLWKIKIKDSEILDKTPLQISLYFILPSTLLFLGGFGFSIFTLSLEFIIIILLTQAFWNIPIIIIGIRLRNKYKRSKKNYDWIFDLIEEIKAIEEIEEKDEGKRRRKKMKEKDNDK